MWFFQLLVSHGPIICFTALIAASNCSIKGTPFWLSFSLPKPAHAAICQLSRGSSLCRVHPVSISLYESSSDWARALPFLCLRHQWRHWLALATCMLTTLIEFALLALSLSSLIPLEMKHEIGSRQKEINYVSIFPSFWLHWRHKHLEWVLETDPNDFDRSSLWSYLESMHAL